MNSTSRSSRSGPPSTSQQPSTSSGPAPALDPQRIVYYALTATFTSISNGDRVNGGSKVGDVWQSSYPCQAGICTYTNYLGRAHTFPAAAPSFRDSLTLVGPDSPPTPCDITESWSFVRRADGSYAGTHTAQPRALQADWTPSPGNNYSCSSFAYTQDVILVPFTS